MTREDIVALFARRDQAWKRLDAAALAADHAEDGVVESPTAGRVEGRAMIEEVYRMWFGAFPDLEFHVDDLLIDGNRATVIVTVRGTDAGGFMGLPPSGKRFKTPAAFVCEMKNGLIVHERRIYDFTGLLVQIGMLKAKPARP